ncbi:LPS biosynthesis protein [Malaciobacter pacificus]|uniref:Glycosyltransferase n=1 Tax=Malaciobacter pacificus TaxID=1080223 RepID=A0A5C2H6P0_9BACT|nr:WecB/TagA/CpsF family glycosyltransferase [Malaciobacter pacificus]QEP33858.1 glycosyltransferase [Malaciobacter pacificus]GGD34941.1 LPS biosynthesis protein [Malaciobacter pacificus]
MRSEIINDYKINAFENKKHFLNQIKNEKKILIAMNAEKILKDDEKLRKIVNENISYPDGIGAVMALKQKGLNTIKIPGSEFWLDIIKEFQNEKSFYFIGSTQEVIENTIRKLKIEYPSINILGYQNGFINEEQKSELKEKLQNLKPDVIFVAQGSPRQEFLMDELIHLQPALYMGLGGSFDIYGGNKKRAPKVFLDLHLEWLYRLLKEPTRIGRQLNLVKFLVLLKLGKL